MSATDPRTKPGYTSCKRKRSAFDTEPPPLAEALIDGGKDIEWALAILPEGDPRLPEVDPEVYKVNFRDTAAEKGMLYCSGCETYHPIEDFGFDKRNTGRKQRRYTCMQKTNEMERRRWNRGS